MLSFSHSGKIDDLIPALGALPDEGIAIDNAAVALAKSLLEATRSESINGAHINLRVSHVPPINARQIEIQVVGKKM